MGLAQSCLLRFPDDLAGGLRVALFASVTQSCFSSSTDLGFVWVGLRICWLTGLYPLFVHDGKHDAHCQLFSLPKPTTHPHCHTASSPPRASTTTTRTRTRIQPTRSDPSLPPPPPLSSPSAAASQHQKPPPKHATITWPPWPGCPAPFGRDHACFLPFPPACRSQQIGPCLQLQRCRRHGHLKKNKSRDRGSRSRHIRPLFLLPVVSLVCQQRHCFCDGCRRSSSSILIITSSSRRSDDDGRPSQEEDSTGATQAQDQRHCSSNSSSSSRRRSSRRSSGSSSSSTEEEEASTQDRRRPGNGRGKNQEPCFPNCCCFCH